MAQKVSSKLHVFMLKIGWLMADESSSHFNYQN